MGWTSGLPVSRWSLNSRNSVLKLGGPANSAPSVRLARLCSPLKAVSPPNDPRLSPATSSRGRLSWGSCDQGPYTASNSARPDRKSTRLNSSHVEISYAVFCLKKKKMDEVALLRQTSRVHGQRK